ncbi:TonB-dependent receptor [Tanticharoenia sakaeratensis]|uniref:Outer membrane heme receptor n=1 Tax=Tanticharoenia sakaeratensis NBRC 103193 TaxID=1231623 RepID=A0A0D6ML25_9PROT|nr:TonB-dependent receptor [Tanticharoenia sakaeratensis]GAN53978.1 outer membrane heme receptor [Tanticharoenia sakaeratensis NBRC 103193]GBQ23579.1 TonB-dependent receptor [Tanticharoenia sakaeratensis NBRC 103193]
MNLRGSAKIGSVTKMTVHMRKLSLFLGTTILSAAVMPAWSAPVRHQPPRAHAAPAAQKSLPAKSANPENIAVTVRRVAHGTQTTVSQNLISQAIPGTNPMKVLGQMPGIMFQTNDAQGIDNYAAQIYMHGFQQQEIGMTLDDMPLGEMTYRNYNGLNPLQAISSENIARVDVSQSAGAESIAATNNLGGSFEYVSRDPKDKRGGTVAQSFGSNSSFHTFVRFDSGALNPSGTKFFVSYSRNDAGFWGSHGNLFLQQVNSKFVQPIGEDSKISAYFDWSDLHEYSRQDYSFDMLDTLGYDANNYYNGKVSGYSTAYQAALGHYPANYDKLSDPADASVYDAGTNVVDYFGGVKADLALSDHLRWITTVYGHGEDSQTTWSSPFFPSPNGAPMSEVVKEPAIERYGILSALHYNIAHNQLGIGTWYENNSYQSAMNAYEQPTIVDGVLQGPLRSGVSKWSDPFAQIFNQDYSTNVFTAFVQDTYSPIRNLFLHFGFKSILDTTRVGNGYINPSYYGATGPLASGVGLTVAKPFLPHISANWKFLKHHELFFDISESVHTYAESGYKLSNSPFAVLQSAFDASRGQIRPETAWTYAVGYRYNAPVVSATLYAYRTNFENRLQQITSGSLINPVSAVANVGGVTMNGVDAGLTLRPVRGLSLYNTVSYDHATYDNNIKNGQVLYPTEGVQVVNYPRFMYKSRLSYEWKNAMAFIDGNYIGQRNFTYTGDVKAPGYWVADMGAQYTIKNLGQYDRRLAFAQDLVISLNVNNLTNTKYIATMGEAGNPMSISSGALSFQGFELAAPRQYFGSVRLDF